jgi:hypothetical protein
VNSLRTALAVASVAGLFGAWMHFIAVRNIDRDLRLGNEPDLPLEASVIPK